MNRSPFDCLRLGLACLVLAVSSAPAFAQPALRKVAILSTIGDVMTVVAAQRQTGSLINTNERSVTNVETPIFDHSALLAASRASKTNKPEVETVLLSMPKQATGAAPPFSFEGNQLSRNSMVLPTLEKSGATHVLLIVKHRAAARLKFSDGASGSGTLEGLGFYVDGAARTTVGDTGVGGTGFVAPFAYFKLQLVDLNSMTLQSEQVVTESVVRSAGRVQSGLDPWDAMTLEEKIAALKSLIERGIGEALPQLYRF